MTTNNNDRKDWEAKLDGFAFPNMEYWITEDEAKEIAIDFILAITKTRKTVDDKRAGLQIDLAKMAFSVALNLMDELGW